MGDLFCSIFPSVPCGPPDDGQYVWPKHVENKWRTYIAYVLCSCGLYLLVTDQHNGIMLPKFKCKKSFNFRATTAVSLMIIIGTIDNVVK